MEGTEEGAVSSTKVADIVGVALVLGYSKVANCNTPALLNLNLTPDACP